MKYEDGLYRLIHHFIYSAGGEHAVDDVVVMFYQTQDISMIGAYKIHNAVWCAVIINIIKINTDIGE